MVAHFHRDRHIPNLSTHFATGDWILRRYIKISIRGQGSWHTSLTGFADLRYAQLSFR